MSDVIEVSYTGDLLAHRRCPRAWAYEKHAGFVPYEQVQAMEGRLLHHAMEWLSRRYREGHGMASREQLREQLERFYRVLRSRGITTAFSSRDEVLDRIVSNLYRGQNPKAAVSAVIRGATHSEYELRTVRKVLPASFGGKGRILLTGIIDLVLQQPDALSYERVWKWHDHDELTGAVIEQTISAEPGDEEIWDFKATRAGSRYLADYVRQVVTYAALYQERTGRLPRRCVLYFVNEPSAAAGLLSVPIDQEIVSCGLRWTENQVAQVQKTVAAFEGDPGAVEGGALALASEPQGQRIDADLRAQCTGCAQRFDCQEYLTHLGPGRGGRPKRDVDPLAVGRN